METHTVKIGPTDRRCRYWAKCIRSGDPLPLPDDVSRGDLPGRYLRSGEEELAPGDAMISGEENHHRKARGWTYRITFVALDGSLTPAFEPTGDHRAQLKAAGLPFEIMKGAGDLAACVRVLHGVRAGLFPVPQEE